MKFVSFFRQKRQKKRKMFQKLCKLCHVKLYATEEHLRLIDFVSQKAFTACSFCFKHYSLHAAVDNHVLDILVYVCHLSNDQ